MPFRNLAREYTLTTGTADCVLSGAVPGCNTWDLAGVATGEIVRYGIITYSTTTNRPTHSEVGIGTYTTATKTLARTAVESSTAAGAKITLTGLSEVYICPTSRDLNAGAFALYAGGTQTINSAASATLTIASETSDVFGLASLAANTITIAKAGKYGVYVSYGHYSNGADYNGTIKITAAVGGSFVTTQATQGYVTAWAIGDDENTFSMPYQSADADGTSTISFTLANNSGAQIDVYINYVILFRLSSIA